MSAYTKATYITTHALAPAAMAPVLSCLRNQPFSLLVDEATDRADDKTILMMARHYDGNKENVVTSFFGQPSVSYCRRENIVQPCGRFYAEEQDSMGKYHGAEFRLC